jgi:UV DNA damage endonuclease
MSTGRIGYACIDLTIQDRARECRLKTFEAKGIEYISELALHNVKLLHKIIDNNVANGIQMYRISSSLFPWKDRYVYDELPHWQEIHSEFGAIGSKISNSGMRISFHPGHFTILGSTNPEVCKRAVADLVHHADMMEFLGAPRSHRAKINIHIGTAQPTKEEAARRFIGAFMNLPESVRCRLTLENDDNPRGFTVKDLYAIHTETGIPIVFDTLHFACNPGEQTYSEALEMALSTWPKDVVPVVHHSSSRQIEDPKAKRLAHADYLYERFESGSRVVDVMLESKMKNLALRKYIEDFSPPA